MNFSVTDKSRVHYRERRARYHHVAPVHLMPAFLPSCRFASNTVCLKRHTRAEARRYPTITVAVRCHHTITRARTVKFYLTKDKRPRQYRPLIKSFALLAVSYYNRYLILQAKHPPPLLRLRVSRKARPKSKSCSALYICTLSWHTQGKANHVTPNQKSNTIPQSTKL